MHKFRWTNSAGHWKGRSGAPTKMIVGRIGLHGGCSSKSVSSFLWRTGFFFCANVPACLRFKWFKETLTHSFLLPQQKNKKDVLKFHSYPNDTFFSVLRTWSPVFKRFPYSFCNYGLGVWRLNCLCPGDGVIRNKENQALFLLQSCFTWEKTNDPVGRSKESTSHKRKFLNLHPEQVSIWKEKGGTCFQVLKRPKSSQRGPYRPACPFSSRLTKASLKPWRKRPSGTWMGDLLPTKSN